MSNNPIQVTEKSSPRAASIEPVIHSFVYGLDFLRDQVSDVDPADMVAQPEAIANHPSWVIGHLTFACQLLGGVIGISPWLPENWEERFGPGSQPVADAALYETKDEALAILDDASSRIIRAIEALDGSQLDQPFPVPTYLEVFPTIRHSLTQVLVGHTAFHVGQLAVWRKAMGLSGVGRSFE